MLGKASASSLSHRKIFSWQCAPWPWEGAEIDGRAPYLGPGALKLCGLELSHTGLIFPSWVEVRRWPVMKRERLPASFPLPSLTFLVCGTVLMEDYKGWGDRRNFAGFQSLKQMTSWKGRSCWEPACSWWAVSRGARVLISGKQLWTAGLDNAWNGGGLFKGSKSTR